MPRALFLLLAIVVGSPALGEEVKEIPLEEVWGFHLAKTQDIRKLEPASFGRAEGQSAEEGLAAFKNAKVTRIQLALNELPLKAPQRPGFAVHGHGKQALEGAYKVLVEGKEEEREFKADSNLSLVFFSAEFGAHTVLDSIRMEGQTITISYRFNSHAELYRMAHFALIPVKKLEPGEVTVNIERVGKDDVDKQWNDRVPCRSFKFAVMQSARRTPVLNR